MKRPGFLSKPMPQAKLKARGPIVAGSYGLQVQSAPWKFELLHDRDEDVLIWVTRGQGRVTVNGVMRGVSMNNALFLPAGTLFAVDLPVGAQALMTRSPAGVAARMPQEPLLLRIKDSLAQAELTSLIDSMMRELTQNRGLLQDALDAYVQLVSVWLARQVAAGLSDTAKETAAQKLVRRFAQSVVRDYRTARSLAEYADSLDVTATHLTRVCRKCSGKTASDILTERKLSAARNALELPRPAVQDIASSLGFSSPAYFTRFILQHTGKTPSELRTMAKKARRFE